MVHETAALDIRLFSGGAYRAEPALAKRMTEPLTDPLLVQRAARGDGIAFSELVQRHYRRALRVAYGLVKHNQDAEDIVQDAFARVYVRLADFEGASAFYTWLYRIVVNLSIDLIRRRRRERRVDVDSERVGEALGEGNELWPRFDDTHPEGAAVRGQLAEHLSRAFAGLPEIHQAVLLLRELEGMSYDQIAATLSIKKGTVMSRLFHARKGLQNKLSVDGITEQKAAPEGSR